MLTNFSEQTSIINQYISELRDVKIQKDRMRFRKNMERIGQFIAYEISKELAYKTEAIETPLGEAPTNVLVNQPVVATILRAGLPLHEGILNTFDEADNAFISAYRKHHKDDSFEINLQYISCPSLENRPLIICDPMLATGASMIKAVQELADYGKSSQIHIVTVIASTYGIEQVRRFFPKARIWAGAIDEELTAKSYIVPGLGDAGDLSYGSKLQE
ncbi:MAG: uracil phosphoribosyltransferase [Saprospiraceae bacterium]